MLSALCKSDAQGRAAGRAPFRFDAGRAARFGVLPKDAQDEGAIRWFELPGAPTFAFHVANAWQEGDALRIFLCAWQGGVMHHRKKAHRCISEASNWL